MCGEWEQPCGLFIVRKQGTNKEVLLWWGNTEQSEHKHQAGQTTIQNDLQANPSEQVLNTVFARALEGDKQDIQYLHKNYLDHVMAVSDDNGNRIEHYRYSAFGEPEIYSPTGTKLAATAIDNDILWNVRRFEAANGLYMYLYRDYDAASGRWPSRDPIEEEGGVNMYEFVLNSSLNYYDILGLSGCCPQNNFSCDDCSTQCASCDGPSGEKNTCEAACRNAKLSMNCGPDGDDDDGAVVGGGGVEDDDRGKRDGGGGGCRDREGYLRCLGDVILNYGIGFIPGVGLAQGLTGAELNLFQGGGRLGGPSAGGLAGAGGDYADREFRSMGGQSQLDHYNDVNRRSGLGNRPNAARRAMSNLRLLGKGLGGLGNLLGAIDAAAQAVDCYKKYCK